MTQPRREEKPVTNNKLLESRGRDASNTGRPSFPARYLRHNGTFIAVDSNNLLKPASVVVGEERGGGDIYRRIRYNVVLIYFLNNLK